MHELQHGVWVLAQWVGVTLRLASTASLYPPTGSLLFLSRIGRRVWLSDLWATLVV